MMEPDNPVSVGLAGFSFRWIMLTEDRQKQIYRDWLLGAEHKDDREAMSDRQHELHARHVAEQNGIGLDQLTEIVLKGIAEEW